MFTGLITDTGRVEKIEKRGDTLFRISANTDVGVFGVGASIACSGACMTVTASGHMPEVPCAQEGKSHPRSWFEFEASGESLSKTVLALWKPGDAVNLEASLRLGDVMGGHLVSGHVDGLGQVERIETVGDSHKVTFRLSDELLPFVAQKGSVAVDGVSLTVNGVSGTGFDVNLIPHTWNATTFAGLAVGARVNIEIDMLARYVARILEFKS